LAVPHDFLYSFPAFAYENMLQAAFPDVSGHLLNMGAYGDDDFPHFALIYGSISNFMSHTPSRPDKKRAKV